MENSVLSATWRSVIPDVNITALTVDVDNACLWIVSERLNADADTEIDVYKRAKRIILTTRCKCTVSFTVHFGPLASPLRRRTSNHVITNIHR